MSDVTFPSLSLELTRLHASAAALGRRGAVVGSADGALHVEAGGGRLAGVRIHRGPVAHLAVSAEGAVASGGLDGRVWIGDEDLCARDGRVHPAAVTALAWAGDRLVSGDGDGGVNAGHGRIQHHEGPVLAVAGGWTAGADGRVRRHVGDGDGDGELPRHPRPVDALATDGDQIATGCADGVLRVHGPGGVRAHRLGDWPVFAVHRVGERWLAATTDGTLHIVGADQRRIVTGLSGVFQVAPAAGGRHVLAAATQRVRAFRLDTLEPAAVFGSGRRLALPLRCLVATEDEVVAIGAAIWRWPLSPAERVFAHAGPVRGLLLWGESLVSRGEDGFVALRDPDSLAGQTIFCAHRGSCEAAAVSPDGHLLATGSRRDVTLWEREGRGVREVLRCETPGRGIAWLGDGRLVAGGDRVRLAVIDLRDGSVTPIATAGPDFLDQTQRIEVLDDGAVIARSRAATHGERFHPDRWSSEPVAGLPPVDASSPTFARGSRVAVGCASGEVVWQGEEEAIDRTDEATGPEAAAGEPPDLPEELGPGWLREFLAAAGPRREVTIRADLEHRLRERDLPSPDRLTAWEASFSGFRASGAEVGEIATAFQPREVVQAGRLVVARDWPSSFVAGGDGRVFEIRAGAPELEVGRLEDLVRLLALRRAGGQPVARWETAPGQGEELARALGASEVEGAGSATRTWLGKRGIVSDGEDGTVALPRSPAALVAVARATSGHARAVPTATSVRDQPLAEAPEAPDAPAGAIRLATGRPDLGGWIEILAGGRPGLRQTWTLAGRVVAEDRWPGSPATTRWTRLGGDESRALSARARAELARLGATRDPRHTAPSELVAARVRGRGYRPHEAVLEAERQVGGIRYRERGAVADFIVGAWSYLEPPGSCGLDREDIAAGLVPFAGQLGDELWAVAPDGVVHYQEMVTMARAAPYAADVRRMLERELLRAAAPARLVVPGARGEEVAAELGCVPVPEASDRFERWWTADAIQVAELLDVTLLREEEEDRRPATEVRLRKAGDARRVRARLERLGLRVDPT